MRKPGKSNYFSPSSYQPITISSYVGKLFERLLESRFRALAEHQEILDKEQEGFRKQKKYCTTSVQASNPMQEFKTEKATWYIDFTRSGERFRLSLDKWLTMEAQSYWHNRQHIRSN